MPAAWCVQAPLSAVPKQAFPQPPLRTYLCVSARAAGGSRAAILYGSPGLACFAPLHRALKEMAEATKGLLTYAVRPLLQPACEVGFLRATRALGRCWPAEAGGGGAARAGGMQGVCVCWMWCAGGGAIVCVLQSQPCLVRLVAGLARGGRQLSALRTHALNMCACDPMQRCCTHPRGCGLPCAVPSLYHLPPPLGRAPPPQVSAGCARLGTGGQVHLPGWGVEVRAHIHMHMYSKAGLGLRFTCRARRGGGACIGAASSWVKGVVW